MAETRRKCFKCGCSFAHDNVKLFRFPKPAIRNLLRCELWAQYIFPDREYSSINFQKSCTMNTEGCARNIFKIKILLMVLKSKPKLLRTAVPSDADVPELNLQLNEPQAGPSHRIPLRDIANQDVMVVNKPVFIEKIEKINILRAKCTKYVKKICELKKRIKSLKPKPMLTIEKDKYVNKLSTNLV